jgi:ketosteroid isomerase-like protein
MSQENVEVVRQLFSYWARGDWRSGGELLDPNWELVFSAGWFVDPGRYHAQDASRALKQFLGSWEDFRTEGEEIIDAGAQVVALHRIRARGRASGAEVDDRVGSVFTVRDGKLVRMVACTRQEALEAAGRRE